jgi:anti-sigma regulatory factor (Ser/Thr protein kinase)
MTEIVERLRLPPEPGSAGAARRFVTAFLGAGDEVAELAVLLVSELASNVVLHAGTPFEVALFVDDDCVRIEVSDGSPKEPTLETYAPDSISGRGLHMIASAADRWGFEPRGDGKVVWFELRR